MIVWLILDAVTELEISERSVESLLGESVMRGGVGTVAGISTVRSG